MFLKSTVPAVGRWSGNAPGQIGTRKYELMRQASHQGLIDVDIIPFDIIHPRTPARLVPALQPLAFVFEHAPVLRDLCGTLYIWAKRPGPERELKPSLAEHRALFGKVSVVIP